MDVDEGAEVRVELAAVRGEDVAHAAGVGGGGDDAAVGLELEDRAHDGRRLAAELEAEVVEGLNIVALEHRADVLKGELVKILLLAVHEEAANGAVNKDRLEHVLDASGGGEGVEAGEDAEGVALAEELEALVAGALRGDELEHIAEHVVIGDEVEEGGEGLGGPLAELGELGDELVRRAVGDDLSGEVSLRGEEVAIVGHLHLRLEVAERLALANVIVLLGADEAILVAVDHRLELALVHIVGNHVAGHCC